MMGKMRVLSYAYFWRDIKMTAAETDKANTKWENYFD